MATVIENEMLSYFTQRNESEKKSVVQFLKTFIKEKQEDKPINIEEYNQELLDAEAEFERGEYITHEQLLIIHQGMVEKRPRHFDDVRRRTPEGSSEINLWINKELPTIDFSSSFLLIEMTLCNNTKTEYRNTLSSQI